MMTCPRCQENLRQTQRMGVEIDYCTRCRGVWLDGGELEKIIERSQDIVPPQEYSPPRQDYRPQEAYRDESRHDRGRHDQRSYESRHHDDRRHERYHDDHHRHPDDRHRKPYKKKGFLGELFDIFD